jgi:PAS domain S-box-containing protein
MTDTRLSAPPDHRDHGPRPQPTYRVLLVDDVQEERELLGAWLEQSTRFVVIGEASNGPRGVELAKRLHPNLVTLDMSMPGGDGIAALRRIRADCPDSKVVMVSGFMTADLARDMVELIGASACLDKGIGLDRLVTELLKVVESSLDLSNPDLDQASSQAIVEGDSLVDSRLAAIIESSDDAIIGKTLDGTITSWNPGAERLYGYRSVEIVGQNISVLVPGRAADELGDILRRVSQGERIEHLETRRLRKDQSLVDVSIAVSPIRDRHGTIVGASTVARDVTIRKFAEAELVRQAEELQRSNEELEQFAYVASHDLSEPLRSISGYVELLARRYEGQIDEDADRFIKHVVDGCSRMKQLIDDLLIYSRVGVAIELVPTDTSAVMSDVLISMTAALAQTEAKVHFQNLPIVIGDKVSLAQLFQNLIANSVKFARAGTAPKICIEARRQEAMWTFSVTDNGVGIESEYADRVFGMFQRLHSRDAYPGTGIGLAICMRIVRAHRGQIWLDDTAVDGTRFCFTLQAIDKEKP